MKHLTRTHRKTMLKHLPMYLTKMVNQLQQMLTQQMMMNYVEHNNNVFNNNCNNCNDETMSE